MDPPQSKYAIKKKNVLFKTFSNHREFCQSIRSINIDIRTIKCATSFYRVKYIEYKSRKTFGPLFTYLHNNIFALLFINLE